MGRRKVHWTEVMTCSCGARFTDIYKEAVHRHNFPALCRKKRGASLSAKRPNSAPDMTDSDLQRPTMTSGEGSGQS